MYFNTKGKLRSMLASWTSLAESDLFAQTAAGRAWFRVDDLLRLCAHITELQGRHKPRRVKKIMPLVSR